MKNLSRLWQMVCGKLTHHRLRYTYADIIYYRGNPAKREYYCRCRLCGHHYWTDKAPRKEVR